MIEDAHSLTPHVGSGIGLSDSTEMDHSMLLGQGKTLVELLKSSLLHCFLYRIDHVHDACFLESVHRVTLLVVLKLV